MMKNIDIISLTNSGILNITANNLSAVYAYQVFKFKKAVKKAFDAIVESERAILKESGIEDGAAFDKERNELIESKSNLARLAELDKQLSRVLELRQNLYNEDVELADVKPIPFEQFHALQQENREISNKPLNAFEEVLEGVLWVADE